MQNRPVDNLEFALLADGVAPDRLYPIAVDRAYRKLDQIKQHVAAWWKTGAQWAQRLFAVMTEPKLQAIYANFATYPGLNLDSIQFTDPKIAPQLPTHPNNLPRQFWQDA